MELRPLLQLKPFYCSPLFPGDLVRESVHPVQTVFMLRDGRDRLFPTGRTGEGSIAVTPQAGNSSDAFESAHAALTADPAIQFNLPPTEPPPTTPEWLKSVIEWLGDALKPVGDFVRWVSSFMPDAPYARILLWAVLIGGTAFMLVVLYRRLRTGEWTLPRRRRARAAEPEAEEDWSPEAVSARLWLEEADSLADQGHYADAVHCLLFRSIEDISRRRPDLVRPALTSREIGAASAIPERARQLFTRIARTVEHSLFGGRPVEPAQWSAAREAYADFALPRAWQK